MNLIHTYMRFGEDGLTIGKAGNPLTFRVVNDRLAFYMNDTEVAYLSDNKLYVTQAEILARLQIGQICLRTAVQRQSVRNLHRLKGGTMANTVSYSASMRTRKTNSASNAKSSAASQEYYENTYNYVGIVHFAGMALSGKVITGISLRVVAAQAGYGTGHTKTVYVRKANYQSASQSGITGLGYCGDALGTFTGAFYGNTSTYTLSGDLLNNLAAYIAEGNNTICLYNPNPVKSSQGYSTNYLQWSACSIAVTYEEAASQPGMSSYALFTGLGLNRQMVLLPAAKYAARLFRSVPVRV